MGNSFSSLVPAWCLRALTGQTLVVRWSSSDDVLHCVSKRTGVPLHAFYLTLNGKCLTEEALHAMDRSSPIPLVMHGRLRGGSSSVPGDWLCSRCHIGGVGRRNRVVFVVVLLVILLGVRAITRAGRRSPSLPR